MKDPYRAYRSAVTRFANSRESLAWASAYGIYSEEYRNRDKEYQRCRVNLNRSVEKLIDKARKGEL